VPRRAAADWPAFAGLFRQLLAGGDGWPQELGLARHWYADQLQRLFDDPEPRHADLLQLEQIAQGFASRERFLTELTLDPPDATSDRSGTPLLDEDYLTLSTIHSAKGQEWRQVFVLSCVDGCIPADLATGSAAEIEEERRLLYVAMTRAKERLHLLVPQRFYTHGQPARGDRHVYASRSRFITGAILDRFESVGWPTVEAARADAAGTPPRADLKDRMRRMWG